MRMRFIYLGVPRNLTGYILQPYRNMFQLASFPSSLHFFLAKRRKALFTQNVGNIFFFQLFSFLGL